MSNVKRRLQEEGTYKPVIRKNMVLRKGKELKQLGLLEEDATIHDLFGDDGEMVVPIAGESAMEVPQSE